MKITTLAPDASGLVEWPTLSANRKSVVTVGVFDGMHRGHQAVIRRAVELAKADKAFSVVVMFDPRPGVVHAYAAAHDGQEPGDGFCDPMALTSVDQRLRTLENLGVDHVLIVRYTLAFATKSYSVLPRPDGRQTGHAHAGAGNGCGDGRQPRWRCEGHRSPRAGHRRVRA